MKKTLRIFKSWFCLLFLLVSEIPQTFSQGNNEAVNLLLNSDFDFHSFINHRDGNPISYSSKNVAFWNTDSWGDIEVMRESHVSDSVRPKFTTHNMVAINPGKKIWQFFTLSEAGLAHGENITLFVCGFQSKGNMLEAKIKLMKLDSEDGEWSPKNFGMSDTRTFPKHSRGELVIAKEYKSSVPQKGSVQIVIQDAEIIGKTSRGNKSDSEDLNTIGIQVEFENTDMVETAWIYSPKLTVCKTSSPFLHEARQMEPNYRYIPRTI